MNVEPVLERVAERIDAHLPEGNPWKGNLTATVEDPKEGPNTWAVVHAVGEPRELVAGNGTMQASCTVYAQVVPTEGLWSAQQAVQFADELADALRATAEDMRTAEHAAAERWLVLGLHISGGGTMRADEGVGWVCSLPFLLSVQF